MSDGGGMVNVRHQGGANELSRCALPANWLRRHRIPGLALDGLQCKAAHAGRGYEITAWGGWQDKREMRLAVYPLSSEKRYCPDYFCFMSWAFIVWTRRETFFPGRNPGYHTQILDREALPPHIKLMPRYWPGL